MRCLAPFWRMKMSMSRPTSSVTTAATQAPLVRVRPTLSSGAGVAGTVACSSPIEAMAGSLSPAPVNVNGTPTNKRETRER